MPARLSCALALGATLLLGQGMARAADEPHPEPPARPFDLDLPAKPAAKPPAETKPASPDSAAPPAPAPDKRLGSLRQQQQEEDEPEREWPRLAPGQREDQEPVVTDDTPIPPGLSTDPGTSVACLPDRLKTVLGRVVQRYGAVRVTSTYRPAWRARRGSYHRRCEAVDFRVPGHRPGEVLGFVRDFEETGGRKVYWNGLIHVDTGPVRSW